MIKDILKNSKFQIVLAIINILIFGLILYSTKYDSWVYRYKALLWASLPFIVCLILAILKNKYYFNNKIRVWIDVMSALLIFFTFVFFVFLLILYPIWKAENPKLNIKHYTNYIKRYSNVKDIFPKDIPINVTNAEFYHIPGFLQSADEIVLYYIDEDLYFEEFDIKYKDKTEWIGYKDDYYQKEGLLNGSLFHIKLDNDKDFKIYLFDSYCDESGYCNHGYYTLVGVNAETKEVIYKTSNW